MPLNLNADIMLCNLVEEFLDRNAYVVVDYKVTSRRAVIFNLNVSVSQYEEDMTLNQSRQMFFLFTGNTTVFVAVPDGDDRWFSWKQIPLDAWKNTSNHDSCWRSDGVQSPMSTVYFEMCEAINSSREANGYEQIAPIKMHQFNHLGTNPLVTHVDVKTVSDPDTHNPSYFRKLAFIRKVE